MSFDTCCTKREFQGTDKLSQYDLVSIWLINVIKKILSGLSNRMVPSWNHSLLTLNPRVCKGCFKMPFKYYWTLVITQVKVIFRKPLVLHEWSPQTCEMLHKINVWPDDGNGWKVRRSKFLQFILWGSWMCEPNFTANSVHCLGTVDICTKNPWSKWMLSYFFG